MMKTSFIETKSYRKSFNAVNKCYRDTQSKKVILVYYIISFFIYLKILTYLYIFKQYGIPRINRSFYSTLTRVYT